MVGGAARRLAELDRFPSRTVAAAATHRQAYWRQVVARFVATTTHPVNHTLGAVCICNAQNISTNVPRMVADHLADSQTDRHLNRSLYFLLTCQIDMDPGPCAIIKRNYDVHVGQLCGSLLAFQEMYERLLNNSMVRANILVLQKKSLD